MGDYGTVQYPTSLLYIMLLYSILLLQYLFDKVSDSADLQSSCMHHHRRIDRSIDRWRELQNRAIDRRARGTSRCTRRAPPNRTPVPRRQSFQERDRSRDGLSTRVVILLFTVSNDSLPVDSSTNSNVIYFFVSSFCLLFISY
jgi:hypothetical protein